MKFIKYYPSISKQEDWILLNYQSFK